MLDLPKELTVHCKLRVIGEKGISLFFSSVGAVAVCLLGLLVSFHLTYLLVGIK